MINMAKQEKLQAPSGMAGLVRYYEEGDSVIKLKPEHVIEIGIALIFLEAVLFLALPI